jgi:hypothetical protein
MSETDNQPLNPAADRALCEGLPDDIRALGWGVAIHNDYRLNGEQFTFWLFTKGDHCIKGEGRTDVDALNQIRDALTTPRYLDAHETHVGTINHLMGENERLQERVAELEGELAESRQHAEQAEREIEWMQKHLHRSVQLLQERGRALDRAGQMVAGLMEERERLGRYRESETQWAGHCHAALQAIQSVATAGTHIDTVLGIATEALEGKQG